MVKFIKNPAERTRFWKFCVVGLIGFVVDFGVMNLILHFSSAPSTLASSISFTVAVISNYFWNHFWVYPDSRNKSMAKQIWQFFLVSLIGLGIRYLLFKTIDSPIIRLVGNSLPANSTVDPQILGHNITLVISIGIVMLWNFFANRFWTYNDVK